MTNSESPVTPILHALVYPIHSHLIAQHPDDWDWVLANHCFKFVTITCDYLLALHSRLATVGLVQLIIYLRRHNWPTDRRGGELGVLRVREHPLSLQVHPLTAKSTPSK